MKSRRVPHAQRSGGAGAALWPPSARERRLRPRAGTRSQAAGAARGTSRLGLCTPHPRLRGVEAARGTRSRGDAVSIDGAREGGAIEALRGPSARERASAQRCCPPEPFPVSEMRGAAQGRAGVSRPPATDGRAEL